MSEVGRRLFIYDSPELEEATNETRIQRTFSILMWKYGNLTARRYFNAYQKKVRNPFSACPVNNCQITYDDSRVKEVDAVVFHLHKLSDADVGAVRELGRRPGQRWTFITDESPIHTKLFLPRLNSLFNWSMTYRSDSDVPVPYGRTVRREQVNF